VPQAPPPPSPQRPFLILGTLVLVIGILYWAQKVLIPVALAVLLTFILAPVVLFFQRRGLRRVLAVLVVVVLAFTFLGAVFWTLAYEVQDLSVYMARNSKNISAKIAELQGGSEPGVVGNFMKVFQDIGDQIHRATGSAETPPPGTKAKPVKVQVVPAEKPSGGLAWFPVVVQPLLEILAEAGLVVILVIFMLMRREDLRNRLLRLIGHGRLSLTTRALDDAAQRISRLLATQLGINTAFGIVLGIGLWLIGVPYAFLWGFLAVVLRFIPYIGTWVTALLPLTISVASPEAGWTQPLLVLGLFAVLEIVTANVVEPLLFSHSTGISSIALLVSAAFWTWLWGPIGLVLSAPLSVCLAVLGRYVPALEFFDIVLGDEPVLDTNARYYQRLLVRDQDEATEVVEDYLAHNSYENVYDDILLPALLYAKRDRENIGLPEEDVEFIYQVTRDVLSEVVAPQQEISLIAAGAPTAEGGGRRPAVLVLGCPARDEADEVALEMLAQLLRGRPCRVEVLSSKSLAAEVVSRVQEEGPALVCLGSLPPGGLAQARYVCKRLRMHFPDLKIVVGRWGQMDNVERLRDRLREAGADFVGTSLQETRAQVTPLLDQQVHTQAATKEPAAQPA
jgi:predicted PurR-regulated permease PerM